MFQLSDLHSSGKKRKRVGRGGSRGGTSGRGHKGQGSRSGGNVRTTFEGGQMPLIRRIPKRGFTNAKFTTHTCVVNLVHLEASFENGDVVDNDSLRKKGLVNSKKSQKRVRIKILGDGELTKKLTVNVDAASDAARTRIQECGGTVTLAQGK